MYVGTHSWLFRTLVILLSFFITACPPVKSSSSPVSDANTNTSTAIVGSTSNASGSGNGDFYTGDDGMTLADARSVLNESVPGFQRMFQSLNDGQSVMKLVNGQCLSAYLGCIIYNTTPWLLRDAAVELIQTVAGTAAIRLNQLDQTWTITLSDKPIRNSSGRLVASGRRGTEIVLVYTMIGDADDLQKRFLHELFHLLTDRDDSIENEREFDVAARLALAKYQRTLLEAAIREELLQSGNNFGGLGPPPSLLGE